METDSALLQILLDGGAKYPGERPVVAQREALLCSVLTNASRNSWLEQAITMSST